MDKATDFLTVVTTAVLWCKVVLLHKSRQVDHNMADEVRKAKVTSTNKLSAFTRKKKHLTQLLDGGALSEKLHAAYKDLLDAFKVLEQSH